MKNIAYITDIHIDEAFPRNLGVDARKNWEILLSDVKERGIKEIVFGGDMGEKETNQWFFESLNDFELSVTLGNHDEFSEVIKHFSHAALAGRDELFYSFHSDDFNWVYLDSSSESISQQQLSWLENTLQKGEDVLLFIHHCIFPVQSAIDQKHYLRNREKLQEILIKSELSITIFCGHYHMADEQQIGKIRQIITPAASYQVVKAASPIQVKGDAFGYRVIKLDGSDITTEVVSF